MNRTLSRVYIALFLCGMVTYELTANISIAIDMHILSQAASKLTTAAAARLSKLAKQPMLQAQKLAASTKNFACDQFSTLDTLCKEKLHISCKEVAGYTIITVLVGTAVVQCYKIFQCSRKQQEAIAIWKKYAIDFANCTEETILRLLKELPADIETMEKTIRDYCYYDNEREQFSTMLAQMKSTMLEQGKKVTAACKQREAIALAKKYMIDVRNYNEDALLSLDQGLPADMAFIEETIANYCNYDESKQLSALLEQVRAASTAIIEMAHNIKKARFENAAQKLEQEINKIYAQEFEYLKNNGSSAILHKEVARKFGFEKYCYISYHRKLCSDRARVKAFGKRLSEIILLLEKLEQITNELFREDYKQEQTHSAIDSRFDQLDSKMKSLDSKVGGLDSNVWHLQNKINEVTNSISSLNYSVTYLKSDISSIASKIH